VLKKGKEVEVGLLKKGSQMGNEKKNSIEVRKERNPKRVE